MSGAGFADAGRQSGLDPLGLSFKHTVPLWTEWVARGVNLKALRAKVAVFAELHREREELVEQVAGLRQLLRSAPSPGDGPATPRH